MKFVRKNWFPLLCLLLTMTVLTGSFLLHAGATAADDLEAEHLGELCRKYESGDPGSISSGAGDAGGKSYGVYQFASETGSLNSFIQWCQSSGSSVYRDFGSRLNAAYEADENAFGDHFDSVWTALADENHEGFFRAQQTYVGLRYYDPAVAGLEAAVPGFDIHNYSIALRNVIFSRSVQHGCGSASDRSGAIGLIMDAFDKLGGFANQPETVLIDAIYRESGKLVPAEQGADPEYYMHGETAERYGVSNMILWKYRGNNWDVQIGVYLRLRIREPADAQQMLVTYGYKDAPRPDGNYFLMPAGTSLGLLASDGNLSLNGHEETGDQKFRLTYYASGYYTIENVEDGRRLTAGSNDTVHLAAATADNNQLWSLAGFGSGYSLQNRGTGHYLSASHVAAGGQPNTNESAMQWQLQPSTTWTLNGANYPTYANSLTEGNSSVYLRGILTNQFSPIQSVTISVKDADGNDGFKPARSGSINAYSYNLQSLDGAAAFSKLTPGSYTMILSAQSADGDNYELSSPFYVIAGGHDVIFDGCGGTISEARRVVSPGQAYGKMPTAHKDGFIFKGWYTEANGGGRLVDSGTVAGADTITLFAYYTNAMVYRFINYNDEAYMTGELEEGQVIPAPVGKPFHPTDDTYYYEFVGWEGYTQGMTISQDIITFKAQFRPHALADVTEIICDAYTIRSGFIREIPTGISVADLLSTLVPPGAITIHQGTSVGGALAGTGMVVEYNVGGTVKQTVNVVVTGDTNGDGICSLTDMVQLQSHILERSSLTDAREQAADLNGDGEVTITDMVQITSVILGKSTLNPN